MKATIIPIGNSKGIRIPKAILEQCHMEKDVFLEIKGENIIIKPIKKQSRKGWEKYFEKMKENKDDQLVINDGVDLDMADWEW